MITFVRLLEKQYELLPFGALCNLITKMHTITTSKFGKLNLWMQISFIILFMVDLYKNNHVRACVCAFVNFFFKKNFFSETIDWTFTKFHSSFP